MLDIMKFLNKLARSDKYQAIYARATEIKDMQLFKNNRDLSFIQSYFLYYLKMYKFLYEELAVGESYLTNEVLKDPIRREAYLLYRKQRFKDSRNKQSNEKAKDNKLSNREHGIIFKNKKKKVGR